MNIAIKSDHLAATKALGVCVVTESTSGIGLGIAHALAAAGSAVVLNGFGNPEAVAEAQAQIRSDFDVKVSYSAADMSQPASIQEMIDQTIVTFGRSMTKRRRTAFRENKSFARCSLLSSRRSASRPLKSSARWRYSLPVTPRPRSPEPPCQ
jgi:hypothetical protein